jgi:hypothetical protein
MTKRRSRKEVEAPEDGGWERVFAGDVAPSLPREGAGSAEDGGLIRTALDWLSRPLLDGDAVGRSGESPDDERVASVLRDLGRMIGEKTGEGL